MYRVKRRIFMKTKLFEQVCSITGLGKNKYTILIYYLITRIHQVA